MDSEQHVMIFLQSNQEIQSGFPTFQQIHQINASLNPQESINQQQDLHNQANSPNNSIMIQASPIQNRIFGANSPIASQQDEEDFSLINYIQDASQISHQILDISYLSQQLLQPKTKHDLTDQPKYKKKKIGCSCTKRKCSSKYCFCAKEGLSCSNLCKCSDCNNNKSIISQQIQRSMISDKKGCKCKKNFCLKGYCDCFAKGLLCNDDCKCINCKNLINIEQSKEQDQLKSQEIPIIKKKIKKFSKFYKNKKGFIRTNKRKFLPTQVETA